MNTALRPCLAASFVSLALFACGADDSSDTTDVNGNAVSAGGDCEDGGVQCAAYPSCPDGFVERKEGCIPDSECTTASLCGHTVICQRDQ